MQLLLLTLSLIIASVDIAMSITVDDWFRMFCDCTLFILICAAIMLEFPCWFNSDDDDYVSRKEW